MAEAVALGIPVLTGINGLNEPAFARFAEGYAQALPPEIDALSDWLDRFSENMNAPDQRIKMRV
jgi:hypothetical protein